MSLFVCDYQSIPPFPIAAEESAAFVCRRQIVDAGPTLFVVEDEAGHRWGGFASAPWQVRPQFHGERGRWGLDKAPLLYYADPLFIVFKFSLHSFAGTAECFMFSLVPNAGVYRSTGYNANYQYLNYLHNNTMPNGLVSSFYCKQ